MRAAREMMQMIPVHLHAPILCIENNKSDHSKKVGLIIGKTTLSHQEVMVLKGVVTGKTYKRIAKALGISYYTVETYVLRVKQKLNCHSKGEIISACFALGINELIMNYDDF